MFQRPSTPDIETDFVIIGAGVAGITIAEKLAENEKEVWLLGSAYESQIAKAGALRNVTMIPEGTIGLDHIEEMIDKAKSKGVKHKTSLSTGLEIGDKITVKTKHQKFIANKVIIATGAKQPRLDFEGEETYYHRGISDCAVCDWGLFRGKDIAVIGNHEYTKRAAEFMKQHAGNVSLLWLDDDFDFKLDGIQTFTGVNAMKAEGSDVLEKISFNSNGTAQNITVSGLFVEGMPKPSTNFLEGSGIGLDENNYIKIDDQFKTNLSNVWAVGDVTGTSNSYDEAVKQALNLFELL